MLCKDCISRVMEKIAEEKESEIRRARSKIIRRARWIIIGSWIVAVLGAWSGLMHTVIEGAGGWAFPIAILVGYAH